MAVRFQGPKRAIEGGAFDSGVRQSIFCQAFGNLIAIRFLLLLENPKHDWLDKSGDVSHRTSAGMILAGLFAALMHSSLRNSLFDCIRAETCWHLNGNLPCEEDGSSG